MMGLLGVLGLLMAGLVGGSLVSGTSPEAEGEPEGDPAPEEAGDALRAMGPQLWDAATADSTAAAPLPDDSAPGPTTLLNSATGETAQGGRGADGLEGGTGDDRLAGRGGDDQINGAGGTDRLTGGTGDDTILGGDGNDNARGGAGSDHLAGQMGDDRLFGGAGDDTVLGGDGADWLEVASGHNWLAGGMGDDVLHAGTGDDTLDGDAGDDTLVGAQGDGRAYLNGGAGDDLFRLGAADTATGGTGLDRFELVAGLAGPDATIMDFDPATDEVVVLYDAGGPVPTVTLAPGGLPDAVTVLLDGQPAAQVMGGGPLSPGAIRLIPD